MWLRWKDTEQIRETVPLDVLFSASQLGAQNSSFLSPLCNVGIGKGARTPEIPQHILVFPFLPWDALFSRAQTFIFIIFLQIFLATPMHVQGT